MLLSAAVSDATIEFIDGIRGSEVVDSAIPASPGRSRLEPGPIGAWRAHLNAIHEYDLPPPVNIRLYSRGGPRRHRAMLICG